MKLSILGAAGPWPEKNRFGSAFLLQLEDEHLLFDCGPATTYKMAQIGFNPADIDRLFFTHHHYDHNSDYPCFALSRWDQGHGDQRPLQVYGPPPTQVITERLFGDEGAFSFDWKARVNHPASLDNYQLRGGKLPRTPPQVEAHDIEDGAVIRQDRWTVKARRVHHVEPWLNSLAYRLDSEHFSIAFIGDAGRSDAIPDLIQGVDVLVIGCGTHKERAVPSDLASASTDSRDVAAYASGGEIQTVVLSHMQNNLARPGIREKVIADVAAEFDGKIIFVDELMVLDEKDLKME